MNYYWLYICDGIVSTIDILRECLFEYSEDKRRVAHALSNL